MADIYPFPKTAEEQEAERQLTEVMHTFNAAIKHAVQCGFEIGSSANQGRANNRPSRLVEAVFRRTDLLR
ncbi:hypothetical protein GOA58_29350 [Sinorhizobium meliloti]|uniref:hypothetical protein n=1 Tax=Rhizobium meliloti TaxID=382 RepID=UPI001294CC04|nr:hypothetical protein [Sinorhizobium meliloti]MDW9451693.1 hypothetical protein [Sinorhizobium meliloti]MDW9664567.1 hypothetical protein [Sinorhizobium meliloti]MDX0054403.1 hypothetical protein [Sinorhizobium meliloti]MQX90544.1 hypothetical protein [Sinorhizobium meliloti]